MARSPAPWSATVALRPWPRAALLPALGLPVLVGAAVAVLGESPAVPRLPGTGPLPLSLGGRPSAYLVTGLLAASLLGAAVALASALHALRGGWDPSLRRLWSLGAGGAGLLALLPPLGSADALSYAAYGRAAALGLNPWESTPASLPGDPYADAVPDPWRDAPSVYGPLATFAHALVIRVAGSDVRTGVVLLALLHAAAFLAAGLLLDRLAAADGRPARQRAALLWTCNPLLLLVLVAGAHLDALLVLVVVCALALPTRRARAAAALAAAAALVKASGGLAVVALLLARRTPRAVLPSAVAVGALGLLVAGPALVESVAEASRMVSRATPWRPVVSLGELLLPDSVARRVVGVAALALAVALAVALDRVLPRSQRDGVRAGAVVVLAALLAAPYALPWYDAIGWGLLALLPASRADRWLLAHTTLLAVAHVPGRPVPLPDPLAVALPVLASGLVPLLLTLLVVRVLRARP